MLLGVLSDTHGSIERTGQALRMLESLGVRQIVHCGDVGSAEMIPLFQPFAAHFVMGNCDNPVSLQKAIESAGHAFHRRVGQMVMEGRRIAFLHGDSPTALERLVQEGTWDLICHGHTHIAGSSTRGTTRIVNPGALVRCEQPSIAVVRLPDLHVTPIVLGQGQTRMGTGKPPSYPGTGLPR